MSRIIIITGASSGIGKSFAKALVQRDNVDEMFLIARREDLLKQLASELSGKAKMRITPVVSDVSGIAGGEAIKKILKTGDTIDTLVNNAGFGIYGLFEKSDIERDISLIDINISAIVSTCHASVPFLDAKSRIINVSSLAAYAPMGGFAIYAASKSFVLNFTLGFAAELESKGIKVIALCPGPVDTEFSNVASSGVRNTVPHGANPDNVVAHCLRELERGKHIAIMCPVWKLKAFFAKILPLSFLAKFTLKYERRPSVE